MKNILIGIVTALIVLVCAGFYLKSNFIDFATREQVQEINWKVDSLRVEVRNVHLKLDTMQVVDIHTNKNTDSIKNDIREIKFVLNNLLQNKPFFNFN